MRSHPATGGSDRSDRLDTAWAVAARMVLMPLVAAWVRDSGATLNQAWLIMSAGVVLLMAMACRFRAQNRAA